ncbi:twin-arginine translocation signal domain-containing protein [Natronorubrum sp. FCH18a]|uniref:twin-arginine translocation signal domain-containing protein n=1 Tax=Natronorubrum sp. FCH18a TaxID=3447018 RepID=UPI003F516212
MGTDEHDRWRPAGERSDRRQFLEVAGAGTVATAFAGCLDESTETDPHDVRPTRDADGRITNYPVTQWRSDGDLERVYPRFVATADHLAPDWM